MNSFGFQSSRPKSKAKAKSVRSAPTKQSKSKIPRMSPSKTDKAEKELKIKEEAAEEALKKLDVLTAKCFWNKNLGERDVASRMNKASSAVTDLSSFDLDGGNGLCTQLESRLREVELSKSFVAQIQEWKGDLEDSFLRSTNFATWFKNLDSQLQQTLLMHLGGKLIEARVARTVCHRL